jgi:hypothetical protein
VSALRRLCWVVVAAWSALACGGSAIEPGVSGTTGSGGDAVAAAGSDAGGTGAGGGTASGGASDDIQACSSNTECEVVPGACCNCSSTQVSDYKSINARYATLDAARCNGTGCDCPGTAAGLDDPVSYFVATCRAGRCEVVDLRATDITSCKTAADCVLRSGTSCCQGCGEDPVAVNVSAEANLKQLVCGREPAACRHCQPIYTELGVDCTATDRPATDQPLMPAPRCIVVSTSTLCTPQNPCTL